MNRRIEIVASSCWIDYVLSKTKAKSFDGNPNFATYRGISECVFLQPIEFCYDI